jgi:hypothetical protein
MVAEGPELSHPRRDACERGFRECRAANSIACRYATECTFHESSLNARQNSGGPPPVSRSRGRPEQQSAKRGHGRARDSVSPIGRIFPIRCSRERGPARARPSGVRFPLDSPLEGDGFELPVPREMDRAGLPDVHNAQCRRFCPVSGRPGARRMAARSAAFLYENCGRRLGWTTNRDCPRKNVDAPQPRRVSR